MFLVSFPSRALSRDPSGDRVTPRAEERVRAQVSYGNIVLSHLKNRSKMFVLMTSSMRLSSNRS